MDSFERQIIESIYTIRKDCKRPDIESIYRIISSKPANNIMIREVEEKINLLFSDKKIKNHQTKREDSLFALDDSLGRESQFIDGSVTIDSNDITVNISVEIPKIENLKNATLARDLKRYLRAQIVAMNCVLKFVLCFLETPVLRFTLLPYHRRIVGLNIMGWKNNIYDNNNLEILLKSTKLFLTTRTQFVKHELQQKQIVIEKLLDMKENSLRNNYYNTDGNKYKIKPTRRENPSKM